MNILIFSRGEQYKEKGGIERISCNLAEELMARGHQVYFLIKKRYLPEEMKETVCEMFSLDSEDCSEPYIVERISKILREKEIHVILNQHQWDADFVKVVKKNFDVPIISAFHNTPTPNNLTSFGFNSLVPLLSKSNIANVVKFVISPFLVYKSNKKNKVIYKDIYDCSEKLVLLSETFKPNLREYIEFDDDKVCAIPNFTLFQVNNPEEILQQKEKSILFVGRLNFWQKRADRVVKVWEELYSKYPDWTLKIAGDGKEKKNLIRYVQKKGIKNVEFLGFVDPKIQYEKAAILCMTSTYEGFGLVLIESSMHGCASMAFDSFTTLHDIIDHKENGIIVPAFDLNQYRDELEQLIGDQSYRERMQKNALQINAKFHKDLVVDMWIQLFEGCL